MANLPKNEIVVAYPGARILSVLLSLAGCSTPGSLGLWPDAGFRDAGDSVDAADAEALDGRADAGASEPRDAAAGDGATQADAAPGVQDAALTDGVESDPARDRCDVAVLNPNQPPRALSLSGNLITHDPALIEADGLVYLWQTGPRIPGKTSSDLRSWRGTPSALGEQNPAWVAGAVSGVTDLWAPDIAFFGGQYHLYYSASTFGSNTSCIGHATRDSLQSGAFVDQGAVVCSRADLGHNWNAIDPNVIADEEGRLWLFFGSFWDGIKAVELAPSGARKDEVLHDIASRGGGAIEAPFVVRRCGYYYLFVSFDRCCDGDNSTYNIRVGRSTDVLGPYVDRAGVPMLEGGGSLVLGADARFRGPGHNAVLFRGERAYNVYHAYDAEADGVPTLRVAELAWDADGWPVSGGP